MVHVLNTPSNVTENALVMIENAEMNAPTKIMVTGLDMSVRQTTSQHVSTADIHVTTVLMGQFHVDKIDV